MRSRFLSRLLLCLLLTISIVKFDSWIFKGRVIDSSKRVKYNFIEYNKRYNYNYNYNFVRLFLVDRLSNCCINDVNHFYR